MSDTSPNLVAAGTSIVAAEHIALRYLFISPGRWNDGGSASVPPIGLNSVYGEIERLPDAAKYVDPLASFYADVTIPFTTRRQLPVVALTERLAKDDGPKRPSVDVEIGTIKMQWERGIIEVPPAKIPALFSDCMTFFDSGHVVYAPAFLLQYPWATLGAAASGSHDASAQQVTALTSLVGSPALGYHRDLERIRSQIRFKIAGEESSGQDLLAFINRRLAFLSSGKNRASVFADLVEPALKAAGWNDAQRANAYRGISSMTWGGLRSASLEIVGATRHHEIVRWCRAAETGTITVGIGERAIAALGQNVLDVTNQDELEVVDSLSQAIVSDEHALLIHPKLTVLYSRKSRSFTEMCDAIGGCPYVMLTNVVLTYNEYLLDQSAELIDQTKQTIRNYWLGSGSSKAKALREDLKAREQLFMNQILNVLPNIFRYPGEREMFDKVEQQRGLKQRAEGFERFTRNLYELRQSDADLTEREDNGRTNRLLLALGILQMSGLFLAALGVDEFRNASSTNLGGDAIRVALWGAFALFFLVGFVVAATAFRRR
jgi:hypothetical protein